MKNIFYYYFSIPMKNAHPWFKSVQKSIQKEGYSKKAAWAILANASRNASSKAKSSNPALKKVKWK